MFNKMFFIISLLLLLSVAIAQSERGLAIRQREIQVRIPEEIIERSRNCTTDADCRIGIFCPQAIGMDTPQCRNGRCVCGPNPMLNFTGEVGERIRNCLELRLEMREKLKAGNYSEEEIRRLRERYKECLPQPMSLPLETQENKIAGIVKKYREEKRNLTESFLEALKELNEMKVDLVLSSNLEGKELAEKIREINEQRKELVKDYVEKIHELNLARREELKEVVKEIKVGRNVDLDGKIVNISKIVVSVNGKEIEINPGDNVTIKVEGVIATSRIPLRWREDRLEDPETNRSLNVTPERIRERVRERVREMVIERKGSTIVYSVSAEKPGRILGIVPVNLQITYEISGENGNVIEVKRPWWSFLVLG